MFRYVTYIAFEKSLRSWNLSIEFFIREAACVIVSILAGKPYNALCVRDLSVPHLSSIRDFRVISLTMSMYVCVYIYEYDFNEKEKKNQIEIHTIHVAM